MAKKQAKKGTQKKRKLSEKERSRLESFFKKTIGKIDRNDVKYVLDKALDKAQSLLSTGVDWVMRLGKQVTLLFRMLKDWWNGEYEVPWGTVAATTAALLYVVSPFDFIPDFIPGAGYLDDAAVVALCFKIIQSDLRRYAKAKDIDLKDYGF